MILLIYRTRRNLVLFRDSEEGFDTEESLSPGEGDMIDLWWGGHKENIGLILTLAYQIQKSPVWHASKLIVKTIVANEEERETAQARLETFIEEQRIPATAEILIRKPSLDIFKMIRESSRDAGLVFMGMRPPSPEETAEKYGSYYGSLLETARGMPPVAFVLASEEIEFRKVIGISPAD